METLCPSRAFRVYFFDDLQSNPAELRRFSFVSWVLTQTNQAAG
jgi:hypothetical protein